MVEYREMPAYKCCEEPDYETTNREEGETLIILSECQNCGAEARDTYRHLKTELRTDTLPAGAPGDSVWYEPGNGYDYYVKINDVERGDKGDTHEPDIYEIEVLEVYESGTPEEAEPELAVGDTLEVDGELLERGE